MSTTTGATTTATGPPPTLADAVAQRIKELNGRGERVFTLAAFQGIAERVGRPESWLEDQLDVLAGVGVLAHTCLHGARAWAISELPGAGR